MAKINIKQCDNYNCGNACLVSIGNYYKIKFPSIEIFPFSKRSNNILEIIKVAKKIGFIAKTLETNTIALNIITLPAIAHIIIEEKTHHFIVIYEVKNNYITFMDPKAGRIKKETFESFQKIWSGVLILLSPNKNFRTHPERLNMLKRLRLILQFGKTSLIQL